MKNKNLNLIAISEGAVIIAASMILGYIKILEFPHGGSITIGMLPLFIYCNRWGMKKGLVVTFSYGSLQLLLDGAYAWSPYSMLLDYILAYGVLGFSGFFKKFTNGIFIGAFVGTLLRFIVSFISGVTIYRIYGPTEIFNTLVTNPYIYSLFYNGSYIGLSYALCVIVLTAIYRPLRAYINGENIAK